jgi:hypothetical protein
MQTCHVDKFLNPTLISCSECLTRFGLEFQFTKATSFTRNVGGDDHETEAVAIIVLFSSATAKRTTPSVP